MYRVNFWIILDKIEENVKNLTKNMVQWYSTIMDSPKLYEAKMALFFEKAPKFTIIKSRLGSIKFQFLKSGTHKCVILPTHEVRVSGKEWITHGDLADGEPVLAAYNLRIQRRFGLNIGVAMNNFSGHYEPARESLERAEQEMRKLWIPIRRKVRKMYHPAS